ncbi:MAG: hypothetical protein LBC53_09560 [Spirochaetaceae bacterium]|jgi:hypothetical protein|nr:hypothetical protein [Spirochaetaceae bacterium]
MMNSVLIAALEVMLFIIDGGPAVVWRFVLCGAVFFTLFIVTLCAAANLAQYKAARKVWNASR